MSGVDFNKVDQAVSKLSSEAQQLRRTKQLGIVIKNRDRLAAKASTVKEQNIIATNRAVIGSVGMRQNPPTPKAKNMDFIRRGTQNTSASSIPPQPQAHNAASAKLNIPAPQQISFNNSAASAEPQAPPTQIIEPIQPEAISVQPQTEQVKTVKPPKKIFKAKLKVKNAKPQSKPPASKNNFKAVTPQVGKFKKLKPGLAPVPEEEFDPVKLSPEEEEFLDAAIEDDTGFKPPSEEEIESTNLPESQNQDQDLSLSTAVDLPSSNSSQDDFSYSSLHSVYGQRVHKDYRAKVEARNIQSSPQSSSLNSSTELPAWSSRTAEDSLQAKSSKNGRHLLFVGLIAGALAATAAVGIIIMLKGL